MAAYCNEVRGSAAAALVLDCGLAQVLIAHTNRRSTRLGGSGVEETEGNQHLRTIALDGHVTSISRKKEIAS